ncbi:hypothetical protein Tcan_02395 [Toxocara canis]|uniref:Uncharacterized protein n=1 Tax=Toxocara canis TaxID=6265 RepID=A0A0B2UPK0_TOXCA|nr:hypothetical protein Tcan_02395 [Toxocara canis]
MTAYWAKEPSTIGRLVTTRAVRRGVVVCNIVIKVLLHERDNEHPNLLKLSFMIVGFALIGALRLLDSHSHEGATSHGHSHE